MSVITLEPTSDLNMGSTYNYNGDLTTNRGATGTVTVTLPPVAWKQDRRRS